MEWFTEFWVWFDPIFKYIAFVLAPLIASCVIVPAYLPQAIKTQISKNVSGISLWFWILINIFLLCMWTNSLGALIYDGRLGYFITETLNWAFAIWVLVQVIVFGKEDRRKEKQKRKLAKMDKKVKKFLNLF